jgi:hypothetical protein
VSDELPRRLRHVADTSPFVNVNMAALLTAAADEIDRLRAEAFRVWTVVGAWDGDDACILTPDETAAYVDAHPEVLARARQIAADHGDGAA